MKTIKKIKKPEKKYLMKLGLTMSLLLVLGLATLLPAVVLAGGFTQTTFGGRRTSMNTNMGAPDDLTALFHNPAGLADQPGLRFHLSASLAFAQQEFTLKAQDPRLYPDIYKDCENNDYSSSSCAWPVDEEGYYRDPIQPERYFGLLPYLGGSVDLGFLGPRGRDVVVSVAVTAPNFYAAYLPEDAPTAYNIIGGYFLVLSSTAGFGWRLHPRLSVGASLSYNYMRLTMSQKISLAASLPPDVAAMGQSLLGDLRMDYEGEDHGLGWSLGILATLVPGLTLGLSYSGATPARFEGDVSFTALGQQAQQFPGLLASSLRTFGYKLPVGLEIEIPIPHALQGGLNLAPRPWLEVGFDVRLWLYNLITSQALVPVYDPSAPGKEPLTEEGLSRDKDYHLSYQVALGLLVRPLAVDPSLELMTGAAYDRSPTPGTSFTLDNPALSHVKLTVGARWMPRPWLRLSLSYFLNIALARDIRGSETNPPTNVRGKGYSHSPGLEVETLF